MRLLARSIVTTIGVALAVAACGETAGDEDNPGAPGTPLASEAGDEVDVTGAAEGKVVGQNGAYGSDDESSGAACFIALDDEALDRLWQLTDAGRQVPPAQRPSDLAAPTVGVFMGVRPTGGHSIDIVSYVLAEDVAQLLVTTTSPPEGAMTTQALTSPWALLSLPATVTAAVADGLDDERRDCSSDVPQLAVPEE